MRICYFYSAASESNNMSHFVKLTATNALTWPVLSTERMLVASSLTALAGGHTPSKTNQKRQAEASTQKTKGGKGSAWVGQHIAHKATVWPS